MSLNEYFQDEKVIRPIVKEPVCEECGKPSEWIVTGIKNTANKINDRTPHYFCSECGKKHGVTQNVP